MPRAFSFFASSLEMMKRGHEAALGAARMAFIMELMTVYHSDVESTWSVASKEIESVSMIPPPHWSAYGERFPDYSTAPADCRLSPPALRYYRRRAPDGRDTASIDAMMTKFAAGRVEEFQNRAIGHRRRS